jgi:hypothetical protein
MTMTARGRVSPAIVRVSRRAGLGIQLRSFGGRRNDLGEFSRRFKRAVSFVLVHRTTIYTASIYAPARGKSIEGNSCLLTAVIARHNPAKGSNFVPLDFKTQPTYQIYSPALDIGVEKEKYISRLPRSSCGGRGIETCLITSKSKRET